MELLNCTKCGKSYKVSNYRKNTSKFCSVKCHLEDLSIKLQKRKTVYCEICGKEIWENPSRKRRTCSRHCSGMLGNRFKKGMPSWNKGIPMRKESREKLSRFWRGKRINEKNYAWKGEKVSYHGLHTYIGKHLENIKKCTFCGLDDPKRKYHWANISGTYKRDFSDWIRLCVPCHSLMDRQRYKNKS